MYLYRSPSYQALPVSRSSSRLGLNRSASFSTYRFPPSRSASTVFGRALDSSARYRTPPLHSVAVQRSTPHYSDRYPYVRYSYGSLDSGLGIIEQTSTASRSDYTQRYKSPRKFLEGAWSMYQTSRSLSPVYGTSSYISRPRAPYRPYIRYMPVEDAVDMYKNRFLTSSALSKYWLSSNTWLSRREKELNLSRSTSLGSYSYYSRYTDPIRYGKFY